MSVLSRCWYVVPIICVLQKFSQRDLDYDRDTRHGATQGARFP